MEPVTPTPTLDRSAQSGSFTIPIETPVDLHGVGVAMERLSGVIDDLAGLIPQLDQRIGWILVDGSPFDQIREEVKAPLRSSLTETLQFRADQIGEIATAVRSIIGRVDL